MPFVGRRLGDIKILKWILGNKLSALAVLQELFEDHTFPISSLLAAFLGALISIIIKIGGF